jgi:GNAT superfamily N-acetyltransferase
MLDYTLVTPQATYRPLTPRDLPGYVAMVQAFYRETRPDREFSAEQALTTVRELGKRKDRGSILVFEREEECVGYVILVTSWSNEYGGAVLSIDELFVARPHRRKGIASDFISLLGRVAPEDCVRICLEGDRRNRAALALYKKLGFESMDRTVLTARSRTPSAPPGRER